MGNAAIAPDDDWSLDPVPTPEAAVDPGRDAVESAKAQGTLGVGDVVGLPGLIGQGIQSGVKWVARKGMEGANYLGADIPVDQVMSDVDRGLKEGLGPDERRAVEEGRAIPSAEMGTLPTPQGVEAVIKEKLPYTQYEGKTPQGRIVGDTARFATGNALLGPMGPGAVVLRVGEGAAAGLGSGAAGEWALASGAPEYETVARFAGALAAPMAGKSAWRLAKPWAMPNAFADDTAMRLLAEDIRSGRSNMTIDQINEAAINGANPSIIDMAGPKTRAWLGEHYGLTPETIEQARSLNQMLDERAADGAGRSRAFMERNYPDLTGFTMEDNVLAASKAETKRLYDLAKKAPGSQSMWTPELEKLSNNGYISETMDSVKRDFLDNKIPSAWGVNIPTGGMPPNWQYWDVVKKRLDGVVNGAKPNRVTGTGDQATFDSAREARDALVDQIDAAIPGYKTARDSHSDVLGSLSAPEVGEKFGRMTKTRDVNEALGAFAGYGPEQQQLFRRGLVRSFYDQLGAPGAKTSTVLRRLTADGTSDGFRIVLGDTEYNRLVGNLAAEDLMARSRAINDMGSKGFWTAEGSKALGPLAVGQIASYLAHGEVAALNAPAILSGAYVTSKIAKDLAMNYAERRIAPRVFELMRSTDPDDRIRLGEMIARNPDAGSFVRKITDAFGNVPLKWAQSQQTSTKPVDEWSLDPAPENYDAVPNGLQTGGRVQRKAGGRVKGNPISAEVKKVRALLSHKTATMLSMPDDAIATALQIAKGG